MAGHMRDIRGQRFGRLVVVAYSHDVIGTVKKGPSKGLTYRNHYWVCKCDCGKTVTMRRSNFTSGLVYSCGCYNKEKATKHGMSKSAEYKTWRAMLDRCTNPKVGSFKYYGERGITVCGQWKESFETFYKDMGPRPSPKHSIDRLDNEKNYSPDNCRWTLAKSQIRNRRTTVRITVNGVTKSVYDLFDDYRITDKRAQSRILYRISHGFSVEEAFTERRFRKPKRTESERKPQ
jgi:hypothetical protein